MKKHALACLSALALACASLGQATAADMTFFTWSGYELPEFHPKFLEKHPDGADIVTFADDNEALAKVRSGFRPDVAHPCTFKVDEWKAAGLLQPIDPSRLTHWGEVLPALKKLPGVMDPDGTVWMVPWDWGNTSVIYRTDLVTENTDSWALLWDEKYAGRLATLDASDTPIVAAKLAGVDPFNASEADIARIGEKLREQRPLLRFYTADQASLGQALASGELVAAMGWQAAFAAVKSTGAPVAYMQPKEGMLTWACGLVMLKDAKNVDAAYDFINARLDPEAEKNLISMYGYGASLQTAFDKFTPAELEAQSLPTDPEAALSTTTIMQPQKNSDAIVQVFEDVKAGG